MKLRIFCCWLANNRYIGRFRLCDVINSEPKRLYYAYLVSCDSNKVDENKHVRFRSPKLNVHDFKYNQNLLIVSCFIYMYNFQTALLILCIIIMSFKTEKKMLKDNTYKIPNALNYRRSVFNHFSCK